MFLTEIILTVLTFLTDIIPTVLICLTEIVLTMLIFLNGIFLTLTFFTWTPLAFAKGGSRRKWCRRGAAGSSWTGLPSN